MLSLCVSLALNSSWKWGKKMCHAYFPTFFISFLSFQLLSPSSPCHCTAHTPNKTRTSKKCLLNCVCQLDVRFQNVRCAKVRRAPPDIPNVGAGQKTFLKLVKYLWFWSHWRMKKKKLREREKKQEKCKEGKIYKKSGEISEEHFIHRKVCEKKISQKKIRKRVRKLKIAQCA